VERPHDGSDVTGFGGLDNSTCKKVLDLLEPGDLRLGQAVIKKVAVFKLGVNNRSRDGGSCFGIKIWMDTAKLTNMVTAGFGKGEVFIDYEAKVSSGVRSCGFWQVVY